VYNYVTMKTPPPKRSRNAAATRQAILASARVAFARAGYEGTGVREIARGAGVTAMLVNRYFGSKVKLFEEAVVETMATTAVIMPEILKAPASGKAIATALVSITNTGATPLAGFQIMLRSASSEVAAAIGREQIEKFHHKKIAGALHGEMAAQRAAVLLSLIAGFQMMRQMIGLRSLSRAEPDALVKILSPLFQKLIDGDGPTRGKQTLRRRGT
jgi:AcrR family transcriptional regulator